MMMNIVDIGTRFQLEIVVKEGHGTPSSMECLDTFLFHWVSWAGYPKEMYVDRKVLIYSPAKNAMQSGRTCTNP